MTEEKAWEAHVHEQEEQVTKAFVSICAYMPFQNAASQFAPFSGFVFSVEDQWILVTAEHVFTGHEDHVGLDLLLERHPETHIELQPFWGGRDTATKFVTDPARRFSTTQLANAWIDKLEEPAFYAMKNADIICIPLSDYFEQNLSAVGVQPLLWDQVRLVPQDEAIALLSGKTVTTMLFGIPATGVQTKDGTASAWLLRLPVEPAGEELPFTYWLPAWNTDEVPDDVRGASGGPIMMLGADKPYLMGIQIAQDRLNGQRRLKAVNAFPFFEFIASWVRYVKESADA